jgi:hypothetical protein
MPKKYPIVDPDAAVAALKLVCAGPACPPCSFRLSHTTGASGQLLQCVLGR